MPSRYRRRRLKYEERAVALPTGVTLFTAVSPGPANRTLLVIHGGPDWDHTYLREPIARLAGRYRLVLPDLRGCGRSSTGLPDAQYTPDAVAGDLLALLDQLGVARAAVLGFSFGGFIAQRLPAAAPERVTRLIVAWLPGAETRLSATGRPVLLLQGAKDMTFPAGLAGQAAARIPCATAVVLPGAGHMAHVDDPHGWLHAVSDFLASGAGK